MVVSYSILLIATLLTMCQVFLAYGEYLKDSWIFYILVIAIAVIVNLGWFHIATRHKPGELYKLGMAWDTIMGFCWVLLPAIFFEVGITPTKIIGLALLGLGTVLIYV